MPRSQCLESEPQDEVSAFWSILVHCCPWPPFAWPRSPFDAPAMPCGLTWWARPDGFKEITCEVPTAWTSVELFGRPNLKVSLILTMKECVCVCAPLTLLYSECFVILYRLIHGQSMILISEIFVDTAGPRHQEGVSASGVRISVSTEPASKPWGLHSTVSTLTSFQVDPESGPFLLPSSNPRSHAHQR